MSELNESKILQIRTAELDKANARNRTLTDEINRLREAGPMNKEAQAVMRAVKLYIDAPEDGWGDETSNEFQRLKSAYELWEQTKWKEGS